MKLPPKLRDLGVEDVQFIDTEFLARPGEHVTPRCVCGRSAVTGREIRQFANGNRSHYPFPQTKKTLFVSYSFPAEDSYFLAMGWKLPATRIDLYGEASLLENGRSRFPSLLGTAAKFGMDAIEAAEKTETQRRNRILASEVSTSAMYGAMYGQMSQGLARATGISRSVAEMVHRNLQRIYSQTRQPNGDEM
jgi:hypothetical protein